MPADPLKIPSLAKEKKRRGAGENDLIFIGMADVSNLHWCEQKSLYKNRQIEDAFFINYLIDR